MSGAAAGVGLRSCATVKTCRRMRSMRAPGGMDESSGQGRARLATLMAHCERRIQ